MGLLVDYHSRETWYIDRDEDDATRGSKEPTMTNPEPGRNTTDSLNTGNRGLCRVCLFVLNM